jgi:hypothetical protein
MELTSTNVQEVCKSCLFTESEIGENHGETPDGAVVVEGVVGGFGFHPERLEQQRENVRSMLACLPDEFRKSKGGGWTFLNACNTRAGNQWGEHTDMNALFCLGIGLGLASFQLPREMWSVLPGGMPYVAVDA